VYPAAFEYFAPDTVEDALELLTRCGEDAKILAGGQSLIPMMKLRIASPRYLIDVNRIASLRGFRRSGDRLVCGALCRHAEVAASPLVRQHLPIMTDAANLTADVQVRNRGTVGGSLAHADPAGDWPAALLALDTAVTIAGPGGVRTIPLREFIVDAYTTQLGAHEILTEVSVPFPEQPCGGAYVKFERRAGDFAVASVGIQLGLDGNGRCRSAAVSLGALGAAPMRVQAAEEVLQGAAASPGILDEAERLVRAMAQPFADTRGSVDYKRHLAGVLFRRAFSAALNRAHGQSVETVHV
jgi:aerobic carbon-monoxide dehydrogenase medium subunit